MNGKHRVHQWVTVVVNHGQLMMNNCEPTWLIDGHGMIGIITNKRRFMYQLNGCIGKSVNGGTLQYHPNTILLGTTTLTIGCTSLMQTANPYIWLVQELISTGCLAGLFGLISKSNQIIISLKPPVDIPPARPTARRGGRPMTRVLPSSSASLQIFGSAGGNINSP